MSVSQVKNIAIAVINGIFALIILLTTNLSRSSLLPISFLITISTYTVATASDRLVPKPQEPKVIKRTKVYRINPDDNSLSD